MSKSSPCPTCKGKGVTPCPIEYDDEDHPESCAVCGGNRSLRVECLDCEGTGKYDESHS